MILLKGIALYSKVSPMFSYILKVGSTAILLLENGVDINGVARILLSVLRNIMQQHNKLEPQR